MSSQRDRDVFRRAEAIRQAFHDRWAGRTPRRDVSMSTSAETPARIAVDQHLWHRAQVEAGHDLCRAAGFRDFADANDADADVMLSSFVTDTPEVPEAVAFASAASGIPVEELSEDREVLSDSARIEQLQAADSLLDFLPGLHKRAA